jgi:phage-related protein
MAGKGIVGKLSAKIVPDLDGFVRDLHAKLREEAKKVHDLQVEVRAQVRVDDAALTRLQQRLDNADTVIHAAVRVDDDAVARLSRNLDEMHARINADVHLSDHSKAVVNKELDDIAGYIDAKVVLSKEDLAEAQRRINNLKSDIRVHMHLVKGEVDKAKAQIESIADDIKITPKTDAAKLKALRARIQHALHGIDVSAHLSEVSKRRLKHQLEKMDADITVNVDVDRGVARAKMAWLTRDRWVKIKPYLDNVAVQKVVTGLAALSGARALKDVGDRFKDLLKDLDRTALKTGIVTSSFLALAGAAGALSGNLVAAAGALVKMTPAMLAVPGIALGMGAALYTLIRSLGNYADEIKDVNEKTSQMEAAFNRAFWDQAAQPIRELADAVLPTLQTGLVAVADAQGKWFRAIADTVKQQSNIDALAATLENTRAATETAGTGVGNLVQGILRLGQVGSAYLPALAQEFNRVAEAFAKWAQEGADSGSIDAAIRRGWQALQDTWTTTKALGRAMRTVYQEATAAGFTLENLRDNMLAFDRVLDSERGRGILEQMFRGAHEAMINFKASLGDIGPALTKMAETARYSFGIAGAAAGVMVSTLATIGSDAAFGAGLKSFLRDIDSALLRIRTVAHPLGQIFGAILELAGRLANNFSKVLVAAVNALGPAFVTLLKAIGPIADALSNLLVQAINAAAPHLEKFAQWVKDTDPDTILKIAAAVIGFALAIKGLVGIGSVVVGIAEFAEAIGKLSKMIGAAEATQGAGGLAGGLGGLRGAFAALTGPVGLTVIALAAAAAALIYLWNTNEKFRDAVKQTWEDIKSAIGEVIGWLSTEVIGRFQEFWRNISPDLQPVFDAARGVLNAFGNTWGEYWEGIKAALKGAWDAIAGILEGALDILLGLLRVFIGFMTGDMDNFVEGLVQIWNGLWKGLIRILQGGLQIVSGAIGFGIAFIKHLWESFWAYFNIPADSSLGRFVSAVSDALAAASRWFSQWPSKVKQAFGNSSTWLLQAGKNIINGLLNGLRSAWNGVTSWFSRATASIPRLKGPENVDKALLINSGRWVMQGFQKGLESQYGSVRSSLKNLTAALADDVDVAPVVDKINDAASLDLDAANPTEQAIRPVQVNITNNYPTAAPESKQRDDVAEAIRLGANL